MTKDEALKKCLRVLEPIKYVRIYESQWVDNAIEACKEALEQPKEKCKCSFAQSIVGDGCRYCQPQDYIDTLEITMKEMQEDYDKLFNEKATIWKIESHPKEWQGLSEDELLFICEDFRFVNKEIDGNMAKFAKAIEQKIKEKNS